MKALRIPVPVIAAGTIDSHGWYCWICDHDRIGIRVTGETPAQAITAFREALDFEISMDCKWLACRIQKVGEQYFYA